MTPSQRTWSGGPLFPQPQGRSLCFQSRHCGCMHSLLSPLATPRQPGWPQIWGTAIIYYYIRLIIYPVVQWFFIRDMQPVSFDCVGCHHIYIYIFMITINLFWSHSSICIFKMKHIWLSDMRFCTLWHKVIGASCFIYISTMWECLTACKTLSHGNAKGKGIDSEGWGFRML